MKEENKIKRVYEVITTEDGNAFNLRTLPIEYEGKRPTLDQLQEAVGGKYSGELVSTRNLIEYMPKVYLMKGMVDMIVHEEGLLLDLPANQLATQLLDGFYSVVVGDVVVVTDNGIAECIRKEEEQLIEEIV